MHLVGYFYKIYIMMHGSMNIKFVTLFGQPNSASILHTQQLATWHYLGSTESSLKCSDQETSIFMLAQTWSFVTFSVHGLSQQFCAVYQSSSHFTTRLPYHCFTESQLGQMCELSHHSHTHKHTHTHTHTHTHRDYCQHHFQVQRNSRLKGVRTSRHVELKIFIGISEKLFFCEKFLFIITERCDITYLLTPWSRVLLEKLNQ